MKSLNEAQPHVSAGASVLHVCVILPREQTRLEPFHIGSDPFGIYESVSLWVSKGVMYIPLDMTAATMRVKKMEKEIATELMVACDLYCRT